MAMINFFRRSITDSDDSDKSSISSSEISLGELCLVSLALAEREVKFVQTRITWEHHAIMLIHEKQFDIKYRMPYASFEKLVRILEAKLYLDSSKSLSTCGHPAVAPPVILALTIRWLSGGSYHDVRDAGNISAPSFYRLLWLCLNALNSCDELKIQLPATHEEPEPVYNGFAAKSTDSVMAGCVGALDGFLLLIRTPRQNEAPNTKGFFSGHYQRVGINVQAMCDCNLKFLYMAILAPGKSSDLKAYEASKLQPWIEALPPWVFVAADNAYVCSEHLLTPFYGSQRNEPQYDSHNFYLSQLRIRIEMAFGLLVTKWRILMMTLSTLLANTYKAFNACCVLHNYCIDERLLNSLDPKIKKVYSNGTTTLGYIPSDVEEFESSGSLLQLRLVDKIASKSLTRPNTNLLRREFEDRRQAMYYI